MNQQIWKFPIPRTGDDRFTLQMPDQSKILHLATQKEKATLWAIFPCENAGILVSREFQIIATGEIIGPADGYREIYIGTWQTLAGFVWHVFEWVKY